jgi:uncharacterized membrane protein YebE (DUF533 family)
MSDPKKLHIEIVKLLIQVAHADGEANEAEMAQVVELAREANFNQAALDLLQKCLDGTVRLPAPDLGFLREHREVALAAAKKLITADRRVDEQERAMFAQLKQMLGD